MPHKLFLICGLWFFCCLAAKKIPELMKGLGGGIKEFKKASQEETEDTEKKKRLNKSWRKLGFIVLMISIE